MFSLVIIGILALAGLAKWLLGPGRETRHLQLTPEEMELFGEFFEFETEADFDEMRKTNPHIWMED